MVSKLIVQYRCATCHEKKPFDRFDAYVKKLKSGETKRYRSHVCRECRRKGKIKSKPEPTSRKCDECDIPKGMSAFYSYIKPPNRRGVKRTVYHRVCKECQSRLRKMAYKANPEHFKAINKFNYRKRKMKRLEQAL